MVHDGRNGVIGLLLGLLGCLICYLVAAAGLSFRIIHIDVVLVGDEGRISALGGPVDLCIVIFVLFRAAQNKTAIFTCSLQMLTRLWIELSQPSVHFNLLQLYALGRICA